MSTKAHRPMQAGELKKIIDCCPEKEESCCDTGDHCGYGCNILARAVELRSRLRNHVAMLAGIEAKLVSVKDDECCGATPDCNTLEGILAECERAMKSAENLEGSIARALGQV